MSHRSLAVLMTLILSASSARSACMNRFTSRSEGSRQVVTLLTGKLTFQEAQTLAAAIQARRAPPLEWVADDGKSIGKQYGPLKIVRPMPVGCEGRRSGVVMIGTFITVQKPLKKMIVKLDDKTAVPFEQQP
jgi:hypothetical protein